MSVTFNQTVLEEVHKFLLLPALGVQVLFCSCSSIPQQISSLLLVVAPHIHCFYKGGLVKAVDATFCLFRFFFALHYFCIYFELVPVIYNRVVHACQASYYSNLWNSSKQDYQHGTIPFPPTTPKLYFYYNYYFFDLSQKK